MEKKIYQQPKTERVVLESCTILCASGGQKGFVSISGTPVNGYIAD
jgi:hypothetical protein